MVELMLLWGFYSGFLLLFGFDFSLLLSILGFSLTTFLWFSLGVSKWLGFMFFLVYIGAVLVLFFFMFSLSGKESYPRKSFSAFVWVLVSLLSISSCGYLVFFPSYPSYSLCSEIMISGFKGFSLLFLVSFICLVVWCLDQMNSFHNMPLRPLF